MKKIFYYLFPLVLLTIGLTLGLESCTNNNLQVDISSIPNELIVKRYDQGLYELDINSIESKMPELAQEFPLFVDNEYTQGELNGLIEHIMHPLNQKLYLESVKVHEHFENSESDLIEGFKHFRHYFPATPLPVVYTYISGLNYLEPIICNDTAVVIGLDLFLGQQYTEYRREKIPLYVSKKYDKKYLPTATMRAYAFAIFGEYLDGQTLLDYMISLGKIEYFVEAMYPNSPDSIRFAFSPEQMEWCTYKEKALWDHLATKKLLFSKDYQSFKRYIEEQPFVSSLERDSPGRAGIWQGYRIVKAYMNENPNTTLLELMQNENQMEIYQGSKYKP